MCELECLATIDSEEETERKLSVIIISLCFSFFKPEQYLRGTQRMKLRTSFFRRIGVPPLPNVDINTNFLGNVFDC